MKYFMHGLTIYSFNNYAAYIEIGGEKETYE